MNVKEIKEMITLMNENNLQELELEREGLRLRLKKEPKPGVFENISEPNIKFIQQNPEKEKASLPEEAAPKQKKGIEIKSPMVGTFYRSPSPEAPPFVEPGSDVSVGQVLCIIEAMKLMNEIKSETRYKILEVLVENGQPVEFGQPLFIAEIL